MLRPKHTKALTLLAITALLGSGIAVGAGAAGAGTVAGCLWAGATHAQGATVTAGGWNFRCGTDDRGAPYWFRGAAVKQPSTVPNPGSYAAPAGRFSAGARQPGTAYNDYCVGSQLIEGTEDVYQVMSDGRGALFWKAAAPISHWSFDNDAERPAPTWRTVGLCYDGNLT
ncbi:hypothetical protein [Nocardia sp. NPDC052566]|uniref:hypothetical protein n=1 Tax=Nocardia sp. NPDC052566 TaxID=3364330 RepID=UPI0037C8E229